MKNQWNQTPLTHLLSRVASVGMGTLPRTTSHCGTLPYQRSSFGVNSAAAYVDSIRVSTEPVYSHRHSTLVDRVITRTPSIESIHKDPRYWWIVGLNMLKNLFDDFCLRLMGLPASAAALIAAAVWLHIQINFSCVFIWGHLCKDVQQMFH